MQLLTREIKMPTLGMIREGHICLRSHGIELSLVEQTNRIASVYGKCGMRTLLLLMADTCHNLRKGITSFFLSVKYK